MGSLRVISAQPLDLNRKLAEKAAIISAFETIDEKHLSQMTWSDFAGFLDLTHFAPIAAP